VSSPTGSGARVRTRSNRRKKDRALLPVGDISIEAYRMAKILCDHTKTVIACRECQSEAQYAINESKAKNASRHL